MEMVSHSQSFFKIKCTPSETRTLFLEVKIPDFTYKLMELNKKLGAFAQFTDNIVQNTFYFD